MSLDTRDRPSARLEPPAPEDRTAQTPRVSVRRVRHPGAPTRCSTSPRVTVPARQQSRGPRSRLRNHRTFASGSRRRPGRPQLEAEGNVAGAAVATTCVFAGCSDSRRRARNASSAVTPRREPRRVVGEQREVVDVAQIGRAEHLGDEVIEAVEVDVGEELARTDPATTGRPARAACK